MVHMHGRPYGTYTTYIYKYVVRSTEYRTRPSTLRTVYLTVYILYYILGTARDRVRPETGTAGQEMGPAKDPAPSEAVAEGHY